VNGRGSVVRLTLSPGQASEGPRAPELLAGLRPGHVVADSAYDSDALRRQLRRRRIRACIRSNGNRRRVRPYDRQRYKHRNVVERFFGAIKGGFRRVATRYEKKAQNYLGFTWLAAVLVSWANVHSA
jgi:transposase